MSFRMRGAAFDQGCSAARYAATWVLIVSMTSSSLVLAAPNRRETRRAKKNCCPQPTCCEPAKTCEACESCVSDTTVTPTIAPAASEIKPESMPESAPAPAPAPTPSPAPAAASEKAPPDPKPAAESNTGFRRPKSYSPLASDIGIGAPAKTPASLKPKAEEQKPAPSIERESGVSEAAPIVISDEPPPEPSLFAPQSERNRSEPLAVESSTSEVLNQRDPLGQPDTPPTIEPPKPASGSGNYQEYIDRYFNRKSSESSAPNEGSVAPELNKSPPPSLDEPPTLTPSKPAQEYNDPFRPTSYRPSQERTWRDSSGASRMKARFIGVDDKGMARMIREDGKQSRVPLANLSESDQRYIELLAIRDPIVTHQNVASRTRGK